MIVNQVITPKEKDLGGHFQVRRALPDRQKQMVGPFIFWDHMGPVELKDGKDMTVRAHPHIGLATITYLFSGEILHRDSLGNEQSIRPGEVNWMTAGRGIVHSERAFSEPEPQVLEGIQLWVALPKEKEKVEPAFFHCKNSDLPQMDQDQTQLTLIAGEGLQKKSPVPVFSDLFYFSGQTKAGGTFNYTLKSNQEAAIYVLEGDLIIEEKGYKPFDLIVFHKGASVEFSTTSGCQFMFFGGEAFPEPRHIWWNFVSSSADAIEKAKSDWKAGRFASVIHEDEVIPLPEN